MILNIAYITREILRTLYDELASQAQFESRWKYLSIRLLNELQRIYIQRSPSNKDTLTH